MYTIEEVRAKDGGIKFVKVSNEYRFCGINDNHSTLVHDDETPQSAGLFLRIEDRLHMTDNRSETLQIDPDPEDADCIADLLGLKIACI
jgi:hypothetical protein